MRGCCQRCIDLRKSAGGAKGGSNGTGEAKQRLGTANGRCKKCLEKHRIWTTLPLQYEDFEILLMTMHDNRRKSREKGTQQDIFPSMGDVPKDMLVKYDRDLLRSIMEVMATPKFCDLDRYPTKLEMKCYAPLPRRSTLSGKC